MGDTGSGGKGGTGIERSGAGGTSDAERVAARARLEAKEREVQRAIDGPDRPRFRETKDDAVRVAEHARFDAKAKEVRNALDNAEPELAGQAQPRPSR